MRAMQRVLRFGVCLLVFLQAGGAAHADGRLEPPASVEPYGTFRGVEVRVAKGRFVSVPAGRYRVPYQVTFRKHVHGRRDLLFEPPHFAARLNALGFTLGPELLFARAEVDHVSVGYGLGDERILDTAAADAFIAPEVTETEILGDFAAALRTDTVARSLLGKIRYLGIVGYSQSAESVCQLLDSGRTLPGGEPLVDLAVPYTVSGTIDPLESIRAGRLKGTKVATLNSEFEILLASSPDRYRDLSGEHRDQYRWREIAATAHITEPATGPAPFLTFPRSPVGYHPELRAFVLAGFEWVRTGKDPGPSIYLQATDEPIDPIYGEFTGIARDENGHAIARSLEFDHRGRARDRIAPRHPAIELGEATFRARRSPDFPLALGGDVLPDTVRSIGDAGFFPTRLQYRLAFLQAALDQWQEGFILAEDVVELLRLASLSPPLTFTEAYLEGLWMTD